LPASLAATRRYVVAMAWLKHDTTSLLWSLLNTTPTSVVSTTVEFHPWLSLQLMHGHMELNPQGSMLLQFWMLSYPRSICAREPCK